MANCCVSATENGKILNDVEGFDWQTSVHSALASCQKSTRNALDKELELRSSWEFSVEDFNTVALPPAMSSVNSVDISASSRNVTMANGAGDSQEAATLMQSVAPVGHSTSRSVRYGGVTAPQNECNSTPSETNFDEKDEEMKLAKLNASVDIPKLSRFETSIEKETKNLLNQSNDISNCFSANSLLESEEIPVLSESTTKLNDFYLESSFVKKSENEEEKLRELLQQEVLKRNHCENQVKEFHSRCLNLEQQIAVAQDSLSKKENNIQSMDQTMSKLLTTWKAQETEHQEKVKDVVNERERLASALANQQSVIETFEKDFTEAIGQIEFLQQRIKQLEEQALTAQDDKVNAITKLEKENEELEKRLSTWKEEREDLLRQKNKLVSEKEKLKKEMEETSKKLQQLQNKAQKETSAEKRLLDAECRKNKELKREIASVQKILESLNQQLESERTEKSSLAAEVEMNTSRHSAEVARIKQSCEREAAEQVEKTIFEVSSRYESKMKEDKMLHEQHIRVIEVDFKDKVESLSREMRSENEKQLREMKKLMMDVEMRNEALQQEMLIAQNNAKNTISNTFQLKETIERNYKEVMQAMERCLSTRGNENTTAKPSILYKGTANSYLRNNTIRGVARDLGDVADSSSVVPQKLFNYDDGNAGSFGPSDMNHLANPCPVNTKTESTPAARTHSLKPYTFVAIDPNNRWKSEASHNRSIQAQSSIGVTERFELPPHGANISHTSRLSVGLGSSTPAAVQFYSAGTTPTEETATAPFESRESGDNDFSSIAEGVRTAEETDDDEDESSLPHVISSIRHPSNNLQEVQPHRSLSSPPFSFAVSKDDYSSIQWQSLNSTKFSLDPNTAKSESGFKLTPNQEPHLNDIRTGNSKRSSTTSTNSSTVSGKKHSSSKISQYLSHSSFLEEINGKKSRENTHSRNTSHNSSVSISNSAHKNGESVIRTSESTSEQQSRSTTSSNHKSALLDVHSGLSSAARYTVSFHSTSESPSPIAKKESRVKDTKSAFSGHQYSGSATGYIPTEKDEKPCLGRSHRENAELEEKEYSDDMNENLVSDISSETRGLTSSSPVLSRKQHALSGVQDTNQSDMSQSNSRPPNGDLVDKTYGNMNNTETACFTPPEKQSTACNKNGGNMSELQSTPQTFGSQNSTNCLGNTNNDGLSDLEQRDKELQAYIQMLLNKPNSVTEGGLVSNVGFSSARTNNDVTSASDNLGRRGAHSSCSNRDVINTSTSSSQNVHSISPQKGSSNQSCEKKGSGGKTSSKGTGTKPWK